MTIWICATCGVEGETVTLVYVDAGYTGERAAQEAQAHGIEPAVVKLPDVKRGFVFI